MIIIIYKKHLLKAWCGDINAINLEKIKPFINEQVFGYNNSFDLFLETIMSISGLVDHPFNANFLHRWLIQHTLADRDAFWTTQLKYKYSEDSAFRHLIDWAWARTDKSYISDESIELVATSLCWFLTSSNRELRDCSTKALVSLLENRISILIRIIDKFDGVNDPYVWERIFAVALGCTLQTNNIQELKCLAETVYQKYFVLSMCIQISYSEIMRERSLNFLFTLGWCLTMLNWLRLNLHTIVVGLVRFLQRRIRVPL